MTILHIGIHDKVAIYQKRDGAIICGNTDYQIQFTFDEEWDAYPEKTARFIWNGQFVDVTFPGDTCPVPLITRAHELKVGVYAGELRTTTPAKIECRRSILCDGSQPSVENDHHYANEAKEYADKAEAAADSVKQVANTLEDVEWMAKKTMVVGDTVTIAEQTITNMLWSQRERDIQLGSAYAVHINGDVYPCIAYEEDGGVYLGNPTLFYPASTQPHNNEPFCVYMIFGAASGFFYKDSSLSFPLTLKVTEMDYIYDKMPEEFLPDGVVKDDGNFQINWNRVTDKPFVAGAGEPFFTHTATFTTDAAAKSGVAVDGSTVTALLDTVYWLEVNGEWYKCHWERAGFSSALYDEDGNKWATMGFQGVYVGAQTAGTYTFTLYAPADGMMLAEKSLPPNVAKKTDIPQNVVRWSENGAVAENPMATAEGEHSHAEGIDTVASGERAHAEGTNTKARKEASHSEGSGTQANGPKAHAEGTNTIAESHSAHAEGYGSYAGDTPNAPTGHKTATDVGFFAHAEGNGTWAKGNSSHAEGRFTWALAMASHAGGEGTIARNQAQTVIGKYNKDGNQSLFIVGNGTSTSDRSNAFEVISKSDGVAIKVGNTIITEEQLKNNYGNGYVRKQIKVSNLAEVEDSPNRLPYFTISAITIKAPEDWWGGDARAKVKSIEFYAGMDEDLNGTFVTYDIPDAVYNHPLYGWVVRDNLNAFFLLANKIDFESNAIYMYPDDEYWSNEEDNPMGILYFTGEENFETYESEDPWAFKTGVGLYDDGANVVEVYSGDGEVDISFEHAWGEDYYSGNLVCHSSVSKEETIQYFKDQAAKGHPCYAIIQTNAHQFGKEHIEGLGLPPILGIAPISGNSYRWDITAYDENGRPIRKLKSSDSSDTAVVELTLTVYEKE